MMWFVVTFLLFCTVLFQGVTLQCVNVTQVNKSCTCSSSVMLTQPIMLSYFTNYTDIENASLISIGTWDKTAVQQICKEAKCDQAMLTGGVASLDFEIQSISANKTELGNYRDTLRQMIDCNGDNDVINSLFEIYQQVCSRMVTVKNVLQDLQIKRGLLDSEAVRCANRSWLRSVMENIWHKGN